MIDLSNWRNETLIFYLFVFLTAYLSSIILKKVIDDKKDLEIKFNILFPFFILLIIKGLAECGTDLITNYKYNFDTAISFQMFRDNSTEIGYRLITILIRNITNNYNIYIFTLAIFTLYPVYRLINKYRDNIDVPLVILGYSLIFFLPGISLIRIYLAASITLISFYYIIEKEYLKATVWIFIASSFHITSLLVLLIIIASRLNLDKKTITISLISMVLVSYLGRNIFLNFMSGRYGLYKVSEKLEIGTQFIWYYLPLVALYLYVKYISKNSDIKDKFNLQKDFDIMENSFVFVLLGIFVSLIQYVVPIFGRMYVYTLPIIFFIGSALNIIKKYNKKIYNNVYIITFMYLLARFLIYLYEYHVLDGIMPYINCFDFII